MRMSEVDMGKCGKGCGYRIRKIFMIFAAAGLLFCTGFLMIIKLAIEPNLEEVAGMRAEVLVSRTVNKALAEQFGGENSLNDLFTVRKSGAGHMELIETDAVQINILMSELSIKLQEAFREIEQERYGVPLGSLLGSKIFSQTGPDVDLFVVPLSVSSMDFRTEFESQGINQTKYRLYIVLTCRIKVLAPFSSETFETSNTVPIAEAVILGEVPDNYVQVPEEDILDVTNE